jgi:hypothetical protein
LNSGEWYGFNVDTKNGLGYLLGDFLANTPSHPDGTLGTMAIQWFD